MAYRPDDNLPWTPLDERLSESLRRAAPEEAACPEPSELLRFAELAPRQRLRHPDLPHVVACRSCLSRLERIQEELALLAPLQAEPARRTGAGWFAPALGTAVAGLLLLTAMVGQTPPLPPAGPEAPAQVAEPVEETPPRPTRPALTAPLRSSLTSREGAARSAGLVLREPDAMLSFEPDGEVRWNGRPLPETWADAARHLFLYGKPGPFPAPDEELPEALRGSALLRVVDLAASGDHERALRQARLLRPLNADYPVFQKAAYELAQAAASTAPPDVLAY